MAGSVIFTGRLEHGELAELLPAAQALVFPSTFPEAYGMVAAEAAACGVLPVSAAHSGLLEVSVQLAEGVRPEVRPLLSFELGEGAIPAIAERLTEWLEAPGELRRQAREALVATARERFSWDGVARGVTAAAQGRSGCARAPRPRVECRPDARGQGQSAGRRRGRLGRRSGARLRARPAAVASSSRAARAISWPESSSSWPSAARATC